ncbi:MAG: polyphenol oxidase family protein [Moraxella sp.]|nr:polyphenol oxidase family protein [Moraxella sp.]
MVQDFLHIYHCDERFFIAQTLAGDVSRDVYGFNLGLHVGDEASAVFARRGVLLSAINEVLGRQAVHELAWLSQVHGGEVATYTSSFSPKAADAWVSDQAGVGLCIMTADCVPVAIFEGGETPAIACVHAGWQGLVAGVIKNAVNAMSPHAQKKAYIGACIGKDSYEIPLEMAKKITKGIAEKGLVTLDEQTLFFAAVTQISDEKALLDVATLARLQLECLGVQVLNEAVACSYTGAYHSHRRATHQGVAAGRMAMVIAKF